MPKSAFFIAPDPRGSDSLRSYARGDKPDPLLPFPRSENTTNPGFFLLTGFRPEVGFGLKFESKCWEYSAGVLSCLSTIKYECVQSRNSEILSKYENRRNNTNGSFCNTHELVQIDTKDFFLCNFEIKFGLDANSRGRRVFFGVFWCFLVLFFGLSRFGWKIPQIHLLRC